MAVAARRLDCTRAQVSKQIGELERAFGVRLFERSTRKLSLTPAGEVFHQHALRTLEAIQGTEVAVKNMGDMRGVLAHQCLNHFRAHVYRPAVTADCRPLSGSELRTGAHRPTGRSG